MWCQGDLSLSRLELLEEQSSQTSLHFLFERNNEYNHYSEIEEAKNRQVIIEFVCEWLESTEAQFFDITMH